ncbi:MAG: PorV/PorQ family protein [bacterium]
MLKFKITFLILLGLLSVQEVEAKAGKTPYSFLKIGIGARALGMGSAFVGLADDPTAIYWNPAGLNQIKQRKLLFSHNQLSLHTTQEFLSYAQPLSSNQSIGASINYLNSDKIEKRTGPTDAPIGSFDTSDLNISLGYARGLTHDLSIGITGKFIQEKLEDEKATTFAADLGGLYKRGDLNIGVNLQNIGKKVKFIKQSYPLPLNIKTGITYKLRDDLIFAVDIDKFLKESNSKLHLGIEYRLLDNLTLQGGYSQSLNSHSKDLGKYSFGLGLKRNHTLFDYCFLPYDDIGSTHRLSLSVQFPKKEEAIDWEKISKFVTPDDPLIKFFTRHIISAFKPRELNERLLQAMEIFVGLSVYPIGYSHEPFEIIQYARQSLFFTKGDCDDLSILYATCLESVGIHTAFVLVPEHIFILFDTGIHSKNADLISFDKDSYIILQDHVWLPIDPIHLQKSFIDAWQYGIREYKEWNNEGKLKVLETHKCWKNYPPLNPPTLPQENWLPKIPAQEEINIKVKQYINEFKEYRKKSRLSMEHNQKGIFYAKDGRYEEAINEFSKIINEIDTEYSPAYNNLANIYCLNGELKLACKYYEEAIKKDTTDGGIYLNLGVLYTLLKEKNIALEMFIEALRLFPNYEAAYQTLGLDKEAIEKAEQIPLLKLSIPEIKELLEKAKKKVKVEKEKVKLHIPEPTSAQITRMRNILEEGENLVGKILYWKE